MQCKYVYELGYYTNEPSGCDFFDGSVPNYANSSQQFWSELDARGVLYRLDQLIMEIMIYNESSAQWDKIVGPYIDYEHLSRNIVLK